MPIGLVPTERSARTLSGIPQIVNANELPTAWLSRERLATLDSEDCHCLLGALGQSVRVNTSKSLSGLPGKQRWMLHSEKDTLRVEVVSMIRLSD